MLGAAPAALRGGPSGVKPVKCRQGGMPHSRGHAGRGRMSRSEATGPAPDLVVSLDGVTAARPGGGTVFRGLSWSVREGETWAVVGHTGSGKTALTDVLLGRCRVEA